jgi:ribosomal-protein-alanine N-acetyltransferase
MPVFADLTEPLRDEHVVLRFGSERDIPEILIAHQDDPELHLRLGEARPPTGAELGRRAERDPGERALGTSATLTILQAGSEDCGGQIYVHHVDWEHDRAELGIWVAPALRSRGLGRRALRLAGGWLLAVCGLDRVQLLTEPGNAAMIRAAEAAGFEREGVLRAYLREGGRRIDVAVLSLLPTDVEPR